MTALAHPISLFPFTQPGTTTTASSSSHNTGLYRDEEIDPHDPTPTSASSTVPRSDAWMTDDDQGLSPSTSKNGSTDQEHKGFLGFDAQDDRDKDEDKNEHEPFRRRSSEIHPRTLIGSTLLQSQDLGPSKGLGLEGLDTTGIHELNDDLDEHLDRRLSLACEADPEQSLDVGGVGVGAGLGDSISMRPIPSFALRKPSTPGTSPQSSFQPRTIPSLSIDPPAPTLEPIGRFASPPGTATTVQSMIMSPSFSAFPSPGPISPSASPSVSSGTKWKPTSNSTLNHDDNQHMRVGEGPVSPLSTPGSDLPSPGPSETSPGYSPGSDPGTNFDFRSGGVGGRPSPYPHLAGEMRNTMSTPTLLASPGLLAPGLLSTSTLISNSTTTTTMTTMTTKKNKRLSRKQAPALTESLENLGLGVGSSLTLPIPGFGSGSGLGVGSGVDEWGKRAVAGYGYDTKSPVELGPPISPIRSTSPTSPSKRTSAVYLTTTSRKEERGGRRSSFSQIGLGLGGPTRSRDSDGKEEGDMKGTRRRSLQLLTSFAGFGGGRRKSEVMLDGPVSPVKSTGEENHGEGQGLSVAVSHEEEVGAVDPERSPVSRTISPVSPGRVHALRRLPTPQRDRKRAGPPSIPPRLHSLPVDPASPAAVLRSHQEGNKGEGQLPLDHFSFGQTEGDAIVKLAVHDARRPSEQTFMTGYSLGGGPGAGSTDDDRLPAGTIDLNTDDEHEVEVQGRPRSGATARVGPVVDEPPALFTPPSPALTPTTRPREDLPFGRSRRNLGSVSGTSTPTEIPADGEFTPRPALTPSSSFARQMQASNGVPKQLGQYVRSESKRSMNSVVTKRRPVQWAELDELEAEEARMRADQRREERSRRDTEEKTGPVKLTRRASSKRDTRGNKSGTSTDTSDDGTKLKREGFRNRRARLKREAELFDALQHTIPGYDNLMAASMIQIRDDQGTKIEFGKLIEGGLGKRYVVIFIRHWYCPLCAQYTESIIRTIDQESLDRAKVELIIIGNGSYKMIPGYSKSVKCPFKMYTDSKLRLYKALGMTRQTGDAGAEDEKGDYVRMSNLEGTWQVAKRATKMPLKNPGHFTQIGGEFIFGGPTKCIYAHRMSNTRNHAPIRDIVALAGVHLDFYHGERGPPPPEIHRPRTDGDTPDGMTFGNWGESGMNFTQAERYAMESRRESEGEGWLVARELELERVRLARQGRRSNAGLEGEACMPQILSDSEVEVEGGRVIKRPADGAVGAEMTRTHSRFVEMMDTPSVTPIEEQSQVDDVGRLGGLSYLE